MSNGRTTEAASIGDRVCRQQWPSERGRIEGGEKGRTRTREPDVRSPDPSTTKVGRSLEEEEEEGKMNCARLEEGAGPLFPSWRLPALQHYYVGSSAKGQDLRPLPAGQEEIRESLEWNGKLGE